MKNVWRILFFATAISSLVDVAEGECSMTSPCPFVGGLPFSQPKQLVSCNGLLEVTLNVEVTDFVVDWLTLRRRSYNSEFPGPTWRIKRGDTVKLHVNNKLTANNPPTPIPNFLNFPNSTNIHTHGLHISSVDPADNVSVTIDPLSQRDYVYPIIDNHPSGSFWYHGHKEGSTWLQADSGISGLILIEDPTDWSVPRHIRRVSCPLNCEHDIQLIFQAQLAYHIFGFSQVQRIIRDNLFIIDKIKNFNTNETLEQWMIENARFITINGLLKPVMNLKTGQTKRFRLINTAATLTLALNVVDGAGKPACDILEIAVDGIYLNRGRRPRLGRSFLSQSARIDWLIVCNKPGKYYVSFK